MLVKFLPAIVAAAALGVASYGAITAGRMDTEAGKTHIDALRSQITALEARLRALENRPKGGCQPPPGETGPQLC